MLNTENGQLDIISEREVGGRLYKLFSVRIGGLCKHVIYLCEGDNEQFALFDLEESDANQMLDTFASEGLCCEHLSDVAADVARDYQNKSVNF